MNQTPITTNSNIYSSSIGMLVFFCILSACSHKKITRPMKKPDPITVYNCKSTREYIATYKYLEEKADKIGLSKSQIDHVSHEVSKGCTGAARRFIRTFHVLTKVELGTRTVLKLGIRLANRKDKYVDTYLTIFKRSYLKEYLDLDLRTSLRLAKNLSFDFRGDVKNSKKDFEKLTKFCMDSKGINLSISQCAKLVARIIAASGEFNKQISTSFIKAYNFARNEKQLTLSIPNAVTLAETIATTSPNAFDNFKEAYRFAVNKKGLNVPAKQALNFAKNMVKRTVFLPQKVHPNERIPAALPKK